MPRTNIMQKDKVKQLKRKLREAEEKNDSYVEELNELIDIKKRSVRELEASVKEWKDRALKGDEDHMKQTAELHAMKRGLQEKNKTLAKTVDRLTRERDELTRETQSKARQLSIKDDQIIVKREKINEQSLELADLRRKSKQIGALLR